MNEQQPVSVDIQVTRYSTICSTCPVAKEAALDFAAGNAAIRVVVVKDCSTNAKDPSVDSAMTGLEILPGGDLFHPEQGSMRIPECPGRMQELAEAQSREMGLPLGDESLGIM